MLVMVARAKVSAVERQLPRAPAQEIKEEEARVTEVALAAPLAKVTEERREEERKEPAAVRVTMMPLPSRSSMPRARVTARAARALFRSCTLAALADIACRSDGGYQIEHMSVGVQPRNEILGDCGASVTAVNAVASLLDFEEAGRVRVALLMQLGRTHSVLAPFE